MAAVATCKQIPYVVVGDKGYLSVSFDTVLDPDVTLTGTPTVAEVTTSDFTIGTPAIYSGIALTGMTWAESGYILTKIGGFKAYRYEKGDTIVITGGTNATTGTYIVAGKIDDNRIALESSVGLNANQANIVGTLEASTYILGEPVRPDRSIVVFMNSAAATAGTTYQFRVTVTTTENSSTGVRIRDIRLKAIAPGTD